MSSGANIQTVKNFFAAIGDGRRDSLMALMAEDIEWIIPDKGWPLAGTHRGHAGVANMQRKAGILRWTTNSSFQN
jgi:ketosteroid isomerase-like protein